jgi:hypothetical protein
VDLTDEGCDGSHRVANIANAAGSREAIRAAAIVLWTSDTRVGVPFPNDKPLHSVLNHVIRNDGGSGGDAPLLVKAAATVARCLTEVISNNPNVAPGDKQVGGPCSSSSVYAA